MNLSIVTVHLEDFSGLKRTMESLKRWKDFEGSQWVVIDGGSKVAGDNAVLVSEVASLADVYVSEPDEGIYHAMNKGTALAQAEYVLYLNAGDEIHPQFDLTQVTFEMGTEKPAMIWGTCHERFATGAIVRVKNRSPNLAWYGMPVNHQNVMFRRELLGDTPYDLRYRICADYDLVGRLLKKGGSVIRSDVPFVVFHRGGVNEQRLDETLSEEAILRTLHFGVPSVISLGILLLKKANSKLGQSPAFRRILRRWV